MHGWKHSVVMSLMFLPASFINVKEDQDSFTRTHTTVIVALNAVATLVDRSQNLICVMSLQETKVCMGGNIVL
jgi:hypothetical protein